MRRGSTTASLLVAAVAVATAAATTTRPDAAASQSSVARADRSLAAAMHACADAFGGSNVGSARRTTIGDVRRSGGGPAATDGTVNMPAAHAFGDEPASAPAYWCWVGRPGDWTLYGIDTNGAKVAMYEEYDQTRPFPAPTPPDGMAAWL